MNLRTFRIGGVHPEENKITAEMATQVAPLPKQAIFPLGQHIGAPAKPVVAKGDKVKVGTLIAEAGGFVSAPIYSSVSGTVFKVDTSIDATGYRKPCIIINVEGDEWEESIDRSDKLETLEAHTELTPEEIVNRIKVAGVTGMGGAGFPTFIKLCPPPGAKAECVIINGVECEPYITADYRLMMEHADEILVGLNLLMKAAKVEKGYIGIENNVAYVDFNKCRMCTKCVDECPTGALVKVNFPVKKAKPAAEVPVAAPKAEVSEEKKED